MPDIAMEQVRPVPSPDDELMRRLAGGEADALARLFDRHKTRLFGFLYHLVGDRATAEDLLSETFLRVYQARGRYRVGSGFAPWLLAIARNLALGEMRRLAVAKRAQQRLAQDGAAAAADWDSEPDGERELVRTALLQLPEDQRTALVLKEYQGLSYREIAQVLGCSEEAARARTYRARGALRELLRDWWSD